MPEFPQNPNPNPNPETKLPNHHLLSPLRLHELRFKDHQFKNAVAKIHQLHFRGAVDPTRIPNGRHNDDDDDYEEEEGNGIDEDDVLCRLSDATLSLILSKLPSEQWWVYSAVCKRWMFLIGRLVRSINVLDWGFVVSGRLTGRFPNLTEVSLVKCCFRGCGGNGILVSTGTVTVRVGSEFVEDEMVGMEGFLDSGTVDVGLRVLASGYLNLRKLVVVNAGVEGLGFVAKVCDMIQELELHCCNDAVLKGVSGFRNLQILKLVGSVGGFYESVVTDIGLTILAQGCRRLVKLELSGCEGSYDGIKAIGKCCQMLEELTLTDHRMDGGWLSALSYCDNLKTLRLQCCKSIDSSPGPDEHLGSCLALEDLYLERCQIREKQSIKALFLVCGAVRLIDFRDCWGLDDDMFRFSSLCRGLKSLSLEGCSLLTMQGLDSVVPYWNELQLLRVVSCNNVKDSEVTADMAAVFCNLKELKWRPDSRSILTSSLAGTGIGKKGGRFFKKIGAVVDRRK
ncbi:hypothetical protein Droror1_Dr00027667 [Drosera rotundifolia]